MTAHTVQFLASVPVNHHIELLTSTQRMPFAPQEGQCVSFRQKGASEGVLVVIREVVWDVSNRRILAFLDPSRLAAETARQLGFVPADMDTFEPLAA